MNVYDSCWDLRHEWIYRAKPWRVIRKEKNARRRMDMTYAETCDMVLVLMQDEPTHTVVLLYVHCSINAQSYGDV